MILKFDHSFSTNEWKLVVTTHIIIRLQYLNHSGAKLGYRRASDTLSTTLGITSTKFGAFTLTLVGW